MAQHFGDHQPETVYQPAHYDGSLQGPGRWFTLEQPLGHPVATIYTDDQERLGFLQVGDDDTTILACEVLGDAFRGAAAVGASVTDVFDYWAGRATPVQGAGPVTQGSLENLTPRTQAGA